MQKSTFVPVALALLFAPLAQAKDVQVKVGPGGVQVQTGKGSTQVKTGAGGVVVKTDDTTVEVEGDDEDAEGGTVTTSSAALVIEGAGRRHAGACAKGQDVQVAGAGHQIALTGECGRVRVEGSGNKVSLEAVAAIVVEGTSNKVSWTRAAGGAKQPSITRAGLNNTVEKAK